MSKPVAWMYDWEDTIQKVSMQNRMTKIKAISERPEAFNVRPLYKSPQKLELLSEDGLAQLHAINIFNDPFIFARQVEKAHSIGVDDES